MDKEEERKLLVKAKNGNKAAYDKVLNCNLRFVFQVAKSYQGKGLPLEDLIAEGNLGLVKAFDKFDLDRDVKFISYAVWWIKQSILSALYKHSNIIRLPLNKLVSVSKINKIKRQLKQELSREPTTEEIKAELEDPSLADDMQHLHSIIRLDVPRTETGDADLHEVLQREQYVDPEELSRKFKRDLQDIIRVFPEREQKIIRMYYGIGFMRSYTLREIGDDLDLTRERIRQIKEHVLSKIRKKSDGDKLLDYL